MAFLNIFKKKKPEGKKPGKKKVEKKEKPEKEAKTEKPVEKKSPKPKKIVKVGEAYKILKEPHVTEKATDLTKKNQYIFKVFPRANKTEVKKAIEDVFGVKVISVRIINVPKKKRRLGKWEGVRSGYKKAIVKTKKGQKIDLLQR